MKPVLLPVRPLTSSSVDATVERGGLIPNISASRPAEEKRKRLTRWHLQINAD